MRVLIGATLVLAAACATPEAKTTTKSATYKNQAYTRVEYKRVAVWARVGLQARKQLEEKTVQRLRREFVDAASSLDLWPIDATTEEIQSRIEAQHIDAVLVEAVDDESTIQSHATYATTVLYGNSAYTTVETDTISKGRAVYTAILFNAAPGRVVWQSQAFSAGNAFANWEAIRSSFVSKTVNDLLDAGVMFRSCVPAPPAPPDDPGLSAPVNKRNLYRWFEALPPPPNGQAFCPPRSNA